MKCRKCNRTLKDPAAIAAGIGPECRKRRLADLSEGSANVKAHFLSRRIAGYRQFCVNDKIARKGFMVRIYGPIRGRRRADCSCDPHDKCVHIIAAAELDERQDHFSHVRAV